MTDPDEDESPLDWLAQLERLEGAYAATTLRGYRSDFARFETFCAGLGVSCLPASTDSVVRFIEAHGGIGEAHCGVRQAHCGMGHAHGGIGKARRLAPSSLRRHLSAIRKLHRLARQPNPCEDEDVTIALRRVIRTRGQRPRQSLGLNAGLLANLLDVCTSDTLSDRRDEALLRLVYETLCRRSELVALRFEDITPIAESGAVILIPRAKNDPLGNGRLSYLSQNTLDALSRWQEASGIERGIILRGIRNGRLRENGLSPGSISRMLRVIARRAGLDPAIVDNLSSHSARIGHAQDLALAGHDALAIMRAGGWKTISTVARYIESAEIQRLGVAGLARHLRQRG